MDPALPLALVGDDVRLQQVLINLGGNCHQVHGATESHAAPALSGAHGQMCWWNLPCRTAASALPRGTRPTSWRLLAGQGLHHAAFWRHRTWGWPSPAAWVESDGRNLALSARRGERHLSFQLRLPLAQAAAPAPPGPAGLDIWSDDNAGARDVLCAMVRTGLECAGVPAANRPWTACASAWTRTTAPTVMFIDWAMPTMDSWSAALRLRARSVAITPMPIFVMVSARGRELPNQRPGTGRSAATVVDPPHWACCAETMDSSRGGAAMYTAEQKVAKAKRLQGMRLLLVEDNKINQMVAQGLLQQEGAEVALADDGERGDTGRSQRPAALRRRAPWMLDACHGRLHRHARHPPGLQLHSLPIIAMTANAMASDHQDLPGSWHGRPRGQTFLGGMDHLVATAPAGAHPGGAPRPCADTDKPGMLGRARCATATAGADPRAWRGGRTSWSRRTSRPIQPPCCAPCIHRKGTGRHRGATRWHCCRLERANQGDAQASLADAYPAVARMPCSDRQSELTPLLQPSTPPLPALLTVSPCGRAGCPLNTHYYGLRDCCATAICVALSVAATLRPLLVGARSRANPGAGPALADL